MKGEGLLWGNFLEFPDSEESKIEFINEEKVCGGTSESLLLFLEFVAGKTNPQ